MYFHRRRPSEEKVKQCTSAHPTTSNVPNMTVPRTNPEIWEMLNRGQQVVDNTVQRVQSYQAHALSAIIDIINQIGNGTAGLTEQHLRTLTNANRLVTMSFSTMSQIRKELVRNSLGMPLAKLCNWEVPVGKDLLFPDLGRKLKDKDEVQVKLCRRKQFR